MQLSSLKIIVTGAAQGMGAHFARRLAEAGAQVAAGDVKEDGLAALAESTKGLPGKVHTKKLDVSNEAEVGAFVEWAHGAMGGLNGLLNNASSKVRSLGKFQSYVERFEKDGQTYFRARFGGFPGQSAANDMCKQLKQAKMSCLAMQS